MEGGVESRKWLHSGRVRPMTGKPSLKINTTPSVNLDTNAKKRTTRNANGPLSSTNLVSHNSLEYNEAFPNLMRSKNKDCLSD